MIIFYCTRFLIKGKYRAYSCPRIAGFEGKDDSSLDLAHETKKKEITGKTFYG